MRWYQYLAWKQLFPTGKGCSFYAFLAILGVSLGVMVLLIVQSVMNGFGEKIREITQDTTGDMQIQARVFMENPDEIERLVLKNDFVEGASPFVHGMVMLKNNNIPAFPAVRGIDLDKEIKISPIKDFIVAGNLDDFDDDSIILGGPLARSIKASVGSVVEVYTPLMLEKMKSDEIILPKELLVVGIFQSGMNKLDENFALTTLGLMQDLYGLGSDVHGLTLKIKKGTNIEKATLVVDQQLSDDYKALNWMDLNKPLLFILKLEKSMMFFITLFVIIVASFAIASSLMTNVVRKTKEIGLLNALGASPLRIASCFCYQGFFIGFVGTVLGFIFGLTALYFRDNIVSLITKLTNSRAVVTKYYFFEKLPVKYLMSDFLIISLFAVIVATLAGFLPALRAAKLKPAEALKSE